MAADKNGSPAIITLDEKGRRKSLSSPGDPQVGYDEDYYPRENYIYRKRLLKLDGVWIALLVLMQS